MKKNIIPLCFLIIFHSGFSSGKYHSHNDNFNLAYYLNKYGLDKKNPLLIIAINPNECSKYKGALTLLNNKINQKGVRGNSVYLLNGLRQSEVNYFAKNELHLPADSNTFIADNEFFKIVNSDFTSLVAVIIDNQIVQHFTIYEAVNNLEIQTPASYQLSFVDSLILDEVEIPVSEMIDAEITGNSRLLLADRRYKRLSIFDLKTGKKIKTVKPTYNYEYLFRYYLAHNDSEANFAKNNRTVIVKYNMDEFVMRKMYVRENKVYINCTIMYATAEDTNTALANYPFVLITNPELDKFNFVQIPEKLLDKYHPDISNSLYVPNDSVFIFNVQSEKSSDTPCFLANYRYSTSENKFKRASLIDLPLPRYYLENGLKYKLATNEIFDYNNNAYVYFKILPFMYNLTESSKIFRFPDTVSYKKSVFTGPLNTISNNFGIRTIHRTPLNDLAFVIYTEKKHWLVILNKMSDRILYKVQIPEYCGEITKAIIYNNQLYIINIADKATLYKFSIL